MAVTENTVQVENTHVTMREQKNICLLLLLLFLTSLIVRIADDIVLKLSFNLYLSVVLHISLRADVFYPVFNCEDDFE